MPPNARCETALPLCRQYGSNDEELLLSTPWKYGPEHGPVKACFVLDPQLDPASNTAAVYVAKADAPLVLTANQCRQYWPKIKPLHGNLPRPENGQVAALMWEVHSLRKCLVAAHKKEEASMNAIVGLGHQRSQLEKRVEDLGHWHEREVKEVDRLKELLETQGKVNQQMAIQFRRRNEEYANLQIQVGEKNAEIRELKERLAKAEEELDPSPINVEAWPA